MNLELESTTQETIDKLAIGVVKNNSFHHLSLNVIEHIDRAVLITDLKGRIVYVNQEFTLLTGYSKNEAIGETPALLKSGMQDKSFYQFLWRSLKDEGAWSAKLWNKRKDGSLFLEHQSIRAFKNDKGNITHYIATFHDCTDELELDRQKNYSENYDNLTGLPNKKRLLTHLKLLEKDMKEFSFISIRVKHLSNINSNFGMAFGDKFIQQIATRLTQFGEMINFVARTGGDKFIILSESIIPECKIESTLQHLLSSLEACIEIDTKSILPIVKLSFVNFPHQAKYVEQLIEHADIALQERSSQTSSNISFFEKKQKNTHQKNFLLAQKIRVSLRHDGFQIYYQPQYDTQNNKIICAEALLRWNDNGKMIPPNVFLPVAEKYNLMEEIDLYVLEKVFKDIAQTTKSGVCLPKISINIAESLIPITHLKQLMKKYSIAGEQFEIEVTEGLTNTQDNSFISYLHELKELNITSAIDDFGTGYSSLARLKNLPFDKLKIDKQFIDHIVDKVEDSRILNAIINLGNILQKQIIAEGIETKEQADLLTTMGCHHFQGYFYSKPIPLTQFICLLGR